MRVKTDKINNQLAVINRRPGSKLLVKLPKRVHGKIEGMALMGGKIVLAVRDQPFLLVDPEKRTVMDLHPFPQGFVRSVETRGLGQVTICPPSRSNRTRKSIRTGRSR